MRNIDALELLNKLYDDVYFMYEVSNAEWKEAFEKDSYKDMRSASCKREVYMDVLNLLVTKMREM